MDIIVPHSIRKRELSGQVSEEATKIFSKLKEKPELAVGVSAKGLPARTTLHKVYATTGDGPRRLLFFCRRAPPPAVSPTSTPTSLPAPERWVLLFYRDKSDGVGKNMSAKNAEFVEQLAKNLALALDDFAKSDAQTKRYDVF